MGDMADFALDGAMDDIDAYYKWEQNGSCPQEGYDLGILNEHGGIDQLPTICQNTRNARCKHCGSTSVYWVKRKDKWIMFNSSNNKSHQCKEYFENKKL